MPPPHPCFFLFYPPPTLRGIIVHGVDVSTAGVEPTRTYQSYHPGQSLWTPGPHRQKKVGRQCGFRRVNSHFGWLGLGVAPRFLQKVRARPEILTNKLGLLPRREAAPAARRALTLASQNASLLGGTHEIDISNSNAINTYGNWSKLYIFWGGCRSNFYSTLLILVAQVTN